MAKAWTELPPGVSQSGEPVRRFIFGRIPGPALPASRDAQHIYVEASLTWTLDELADDLGILSNAIMDAHDDAMLERVGAEEGKGGEVREEEARGATS